MNLPNLNRVALKVSIQDLEREIKEEWKLTDDRVAIRVAYLEGERDDLKEQLAWLDELDAYIKERVK